MDAARSGSRYGHRDSTMILIAYRHGLRASELCDLQWSQVDLNAGTLRVRRRKLLALSTVAHELVCKFKAGSLPITEQIARFTNR